MATEKRLIDANAIEYPEYFYEREAHPDPFIEGFRQGKIDAINSIIALEPTVDAVEVPCKIGDFVWAIRNFKGKKHPQRGIVNEMFFNKRMELIIVVKYVARGEWGKTVFATDKEAYAAIGERRTDA